MTDEVVVSANRNEISRKVAPVVVNVMSAKLFEIGELYRFAKYLNYQSGLACGEQLPELWFPSGAHQWAGRTLFADSYKQPSGQSVLCAVCMAWSRFR